MNFERMRKSYKKEILIGGVILLSIISALTLVTTRAKYKVTEDIKLASGTINYKPYDFKIMAMYQENDNGAYSEINGMPESGYIVNEEKSYCTIDNITQVKGKIKTVNGNIVISKLNKNDKCYVWFDKESGSEKILADLTINVETPNFSNAATTDEGVYKTEDGMYGGYSYYWRGTSTTNHVIFANKCWRIVRINGDGTIRLIYNGTPNNGTCTGNGTNANSIAVSNQAYSSITNQSNYVGWTYTGTSQRTTSGTSSNAKIQTEEWFNSNITGTNLEKVADGKFCNDRNIMNGSTWTINGATFNYAARSRVYDTNPPILSCSLEDVYTLKVGAITADEVIYAGGKGSNTSYYLYNGESYWTMTPGQWFRTNKEASVFFVQSNGSLNDNSVGVSSFDIRPVINLNSNVTFNAGSDGTQNNPYIVQ